MAPGWAPATALLRTAHAFGFKFTKSCKGDLVSGVDREYEP